MGRIDSKHVNQQDFTVSASTQEFRITQGFPQGLLRELALRFYTATTISGGSNVAGGELGFIRQVFLSTTLHGMIVEGVDGLGLYRIAQMIGGVAPVSANAATRATAYLPLFLGHLGNRMYPGARLNDMALWCRKALVECRGTIGVLTDLVSGGTPSITASVRLSAEFDPTPNPANASAGGDAPSWKPYYQRLQFPGAGLTAGAAYNDLLLPVGQGRKLLALLWSERNSSTLAEVTDVLTVDTSKLSIRHGQKLHVDEERVTDLDYRMARLLGLTALPTGWHIWLPTKDGKLSDAIEVSDPATEFKFSVSDIATATTRQIYVYPIWGMPVNEAAEAAAQEAGVIVTQ